jgi:quinol---cytochrome-c reductase cytochrome c subunit
MRRALVLAAVVVLASPIGATGSVPQGKRLYGQYCVSCHGANGSGAAARTIGAAPGRLQTEQGAMGPSLRGVGALAADFYLRTGYMPLRRADMRPHRSRVLLSEQEIDALVAYVASLGKGPPVPRPHPERGSLAEGQHLFTDHCAGCHQVVAEGGYVTGAVPPALDRATPTQVAEAVRIGPNVMPRFSKRAISDRQLDSIVRYVEYTKHPDDRGGWALGHLGPIPEGIVTLLIAAVALVAVCMVIGRRLRA